MRFPARLHVLLARDAPVGVVIRRGPSKSVCTMLWNRRTDQFTLGQWLRGRIYERRSDLSPDGKHLIYFAMSAKWKSETKGSWTAISRAPWLKALTLYGKGDAWNGGGLFLSKSTYWLNGPAAPALPDGARAVAGLGGHFTIRDESGLKWKREHVIPMESGECPGVYYPRLVRDGWLRKETLKAGRWQTCTIFEKDAGKDWLLRKYAHAQTGSPPGKGCYWDEHELERGDERIIVPDWEWAEVDGKDIVWAANGCLYRARMHHSGLGEAKLLHDFNDMKFEPIAAPY